MDRLTTNKPVSEMGMLGLAHNCCYVGEEYEARYRDFSRDIDARELVRELMRAYGLWEIDDDAMQSDDSFDDEMLEKLSYELNEMEGLIALFYRNLWAMADLYGRLKRYEDLEEQGLLLELPCKIGDDVYFIPSKVNYELNVLSKHEENNRVYHQRIKRITFTEGHWYVELDKDYEFGTGRVCLDIYFKETWFLSKEEAEEALEKYASPDERNRGRRDAEC